MAVVVDFELFAGNSLVLEGEVLHLEDPVDLTDATIRWWVARQNSTPLIGVVLSKDNLIGSSDDGGIEITNEADGLYEITILPEDTILIPPGLYYHEVELIDADGAVWTPTHGSLLIKETLISRRRIIGGI